VLGEGYSLDDREDQNVQTVSQLWIYEVRALRAVVYRAQAGRCFCLAQGRYRVPINRVTAGNWVLIEGIDAGIVKTATVTQETGNDDAAIFRPLRFNTLSTMKVGSLVLRVILG
jgi:U5 small nuclear ribonucleoprotein component